MEKKRTRILYARYSYGTDCLGNVTSVGMEILNSQKRNIGYIPYEHWRVEKERYIHLPKLWSGTGFDGKAFVKLLPPQYPKKK